MGKNQEGGRSKRERGLGAEERDEERQMVVENPIVSPHPGAWETVFVLLERSQKTGHPVIFLTKTAR